VLEVPDRETYMARLALTELAVRRHLPSVPVDYGDE
jgi:hypothetical protein